MRALLAGLVIVCVAAASAVAAQEPGLVATPRFVPVAGPLLAGPDRVAWVTRRDGAVLDLWVAEPGSGPRRVQRFSGADGERLRSPRLTVSAEAIGLSLRVTDPRGETLRTLTYAGAFGAPLEPTALPAAPTAPLAPQQAVAVTRGCESAEIRTFALGGEASRAAGEASRAGGEASRAAGEASRAAGGASRAAGEASRAGGEASRDAGEASPAILRASRTAEPRCELRLRSPLRLDGDRLRLGISCAGFRIDCAARVTVSAGGRVIARGPARYNHTTPPYAAASLPLTPAASRRLRPGRDVRVTARIDRTVTRHTVVQLPAARR